MKMIARIGIAAAALVTLNACAPSLSGSSYTREQAQREQTVRMGVVESVRQVQIEGTRSGVGPAAGAVVGGIAGSNVGHGRGAAVGAVLGSVAGGVAGQAVEQAATRQPGLEITVKLDSGRMIAVTQAADESFRPGDRVRVLSDGRTSRVAH
jgi:outer membrane lipoprotein SlyB